MTPTRGTSQPASEDLSGRRLGDYQLLQRIGSGGMADVYLARQESLQRRVAFKVLKPSLAADDAYVRRFHNEARSAAALVHANIVQIHEVGCEQGHHFIVQEYVPGKNLSELLSQSGSLPLPQAQRILRGGRCVGKSRATFHRAPRHQA